MHFLMREAVMIRTSLNLSVEAYLKLRETANKQGMEIETIIISLMRYLAVKFRTNLEKRKAVKYQDQKGHGGWKCVRVRWEGDEYEFLIDLRKVHKISVSKLVNDAIITYLNKSFSFIDQVLNNYPKHEYTISKSISHNTIICTFKWIFPQINPPE